MDLTRLPCKLRVLYLRDNCLVGTLDTCGTPEKPFPSSLRVLDVRGNLLTGYPVVFHPQLEVRVQQECYGGVTRHLESNNNNKEVVVYTNVIESRIAVPHVLAIG